MTDPILPRVARNEPDAVRDCIARYEGLLFSLARRFCHNRADAEDAVQDVFVELWRCAGKFDPSLASETTFVSVIARRELIDRHRSALRRRGTFAFGDEQDMPAPKQSLPVERREEAGRACRSVARLGGNEQLVISLAIHRGLTHSKISKATGMPVGTVKTHVRRGLMKLRWMLEDENSSERANPAAFGIEADRIPPWSARIQNGAA